MECSSTNFVHLIVAIKINLPKCVNQCGFKQIGWMKLSKSFIFVVGSYLRFYCNRLIHVSPTITTNNNNNNNNN